MLNNHPSSQSTSIFDITKYIDIFHHLKINSTNQDSICSCSNINEKYYCVPCKKTICSNCILKDHLNHLNYKINDFILNENNIKKFYENFDIIYNNNELINNTSQIKKKMLIELDNYFFEIENKIKKFKENKINEINFIFDGLNENVNRYFNNLNLSKNKLNEYINQNKKFLNFDNNNNNNNILYNINFLLGYDIVYILSNKKIQLKNSINSILNSYNSFQKNQKEDFKKINKILDNIFFDFNLNYNTNTINNLNNNNNITNNKNEMNHNFSKSLSNSKTNSAQNIFKNTNNKKINININNNNNFILLNKFKNSCLPNTAGFSLTTTSNFLGTETFNDILSRVKKFNNLINAIKKSIFNIYKRKNFDELEQYITAFEENKQKGIDSLFSRRNSNNNTNSNNNIKNKKINYSLINENLSKKMFLSNKDDIILNNILFEKYFIYMLLELYEKCFKTESKELQSSHADLMIKTNPNSNEINNENNIEFAKAIEGTNEIQFYEKKTSKIIRIPLKLTKNPFGYTKFPIGCRSLLIGDRVYITGGRDENFEYPIVLIYNKKTNKIKRIMDMQIPRSYHTLIYNEVFETIMVFGGENQNSVEIFDPLINRWILLPELKIPRANTIFYFDKPRGILYNMFGLEGNIVDGNYSDIIEFLDLKNIKEGWNVLDYVNKSNVDLKSLINIYPLNSDNILLYGGIQFRGNNKGICIFNVYKSEINSIENKMLEQLRIKAKKNQKLSFILNTISSRTNSKILNNSSSRLNFK